MLRMPDTKASPNPNCICLIAPVAAATSPISAMLHFERPIESRIAGAEKLEQELADDDDDDDADSLNWFPAPLSAL